MDLDNFISNSGDSILHRYHYENGVLAVEISYGELSERYNLFIRTSILKVNEHAYAKDEVFKTFYLGITSLSEKVNQNTESGIYLPSPDFQKFMKECANDYNLCYGLKAKEYQYLVQFKGYGNLISCMVKNKSDFNFSSSILIDQSKTC